MRSFLWRFTFFMLVLVASVSDAAHCPRVCPLHYHPVCGTNRITYDNMCRLDQAACHNHVLRRKNFGPCKVNETCSKSCLPIVYPMCGTDKTTYSNSCLLSIEACKNPTLNLRVAYKGQCH